MAALVLGGIAFVAVVLSFGLAALVVTYSMRPATEVRSEPAPVVEPATDEGGAAETMTRVLAEIEHLATLRDRGVITAKEFTAQKTRLLEAQP